MKAERGSLPEDAGSGHDNQRIKRYVAKYTLNAARMYGIDHEIGSLEVGKLADIVLWEPKFFGIKPEVVFKGGFGLVGDGRVERLADDLRAAHLPAAMGRLRRRETGAVGDVHGTGGCRRAPERLGLRSRCVAARGCRALTKRDMVWNDALPEIRVDPETYRVEVDGELATCEP